MGARLRRGHHGPDSPTDRRPRPTDSDARSHPTPDLTAEQRGQPVLAATIGLAATTGLRRGELAGLQWRDIDLDNGRLHIRRSIKNDLGGGWVAGSPKTHQARTIALDEFTINMLKTHRIRAEGLAAGVPPLPDAYALTLDRPDNPLKPDTLGQAFARLCTHEHVDEVTLHSLRHFSASMLIASGRDVRTIAGRLGHADATTTLRVYAHMVEGRDQDAADFLGGLLAASKAAALNKG